MAVARDAGNTRGAGLAPVRRRPVGRRGSADGSAPCERRPPCRYRLSCFIACFANFCRADRERSAGSNHRLVFPALAWTHSIDCYSVATTRCWNATPSRRDRFAFRFLAPGPAHAIYRADDGIRDHLSRACVHGDAEPHRLIANSTANEHRCLTLRGCGGFKRCHLDGDTRDTGYSRGDCLRVRFVGDRGYRQLYVASIEVQGRGICPGCRSLCVEVFALEQRANGLAGNFRARCVGDFLNGMAEFDLNAARRLEAESTFKQNRPAALAQFETCRQALAETLHLEPAAETLAFARTLR